MLLQTVERIIELGNLGEQLAAECLTRFGFTEVVNLNSVRRHYPFADLIGVRDNARFLIGVKTRNEMRQGRLGINGAYNLILVSNTKSRTFKSQGKTVALLRVSLDGDRARSLRERTRGFAKGQWRAGNGNPTLHAGDGTAADQVL